MKKSFYTFILLIFIFKINIAFGQLFQLIEPNLTELKKTHSVENNENDIIYLYLKRNYKPVTTKTNIQKSDYNTSQICAFEQVFEYKIKYSIDFCDEEGGITTKLRLPKIEKQKIITWIEKIHAVNYSNAPYEWNNEKNIYSPVGGEAGCYYELKESNNEWNIEIFCGC